MESRLEKIFSMGINIMSLAVWLREDSKCSAAVVGLDLLLGLSMVRWCSLNRSFKVRFTLVPEVFLEFSPRERAAKRRMRVASCEAARKKNLWLPWT